jgi:putative endonuclease
MDTPKQGIGKQGENIAIEMIKSRGMLIVRTNFHAGRFGEIDIIAQDKDTIVFVEVRTRLTTSGGTPEDSISDTKLNKVINAAQFYMLKQGLDLPFRIDVIALTLDQDGRAASQKWFENVTF